MIKHKMQSTRADDGDPGDVNPSNWNDDHTVDGLLGALLSLGVRGNAFPYLDGNQDGQLASVTAFALALLALADAPSVLAALAGAPLNSPPLTGTPTAPTAAVGTVTDQIATMAALQAMRDALVNAAPGTLDTLQELAAALANDPNFATTITTALGNRLRVDAAQGLTTAQIAQGVANLALAAVASSGAYADLTGKPSLFSGAYADLTGKPTLGSSAALNVGTAANQVVELDGSARLPGVDGSQLINLPVGIPNCGRLAVASTTSIKLSPYNGDKEIINGVLYSIPAAGVSAGLTGVFVNGVAGQSLAASTVYYVYLFNNAGTLALDFSTTGHATSATAGNVGREIKAGDDTRSLVGMAYVDGTTHFVTTPGYCLSWFNRRNLVQENTAGTTSTTGTTTINLSASPMLACLNWGDEPVRADLTTAVSTTGTYAQFGIGIDGNYGAAASLIGNFGITYSASTSPGWAGGMYQPAEGVLHNYWSALGASGGGTATMNNTNLNFTTRG